jgi:two-component system chemotaxis response regulator CheY
MVFGGLRVLVVEDEQVMRDLLSDLLCLWGYKVEVAVDGKDGVEKYQRFRPHIVFMDLEMPLMNGFVASREIMKLDSQACIVLVTGFPESLLALRSVEEGLARTLIAKPFRLNQLEMAIQELIESPMPPF